MDFEGIIALLVFGWIILGWLSQRGRAARRGQVEPDPEQDAAPSPSGRARVQAARRRAMEQGRASGKSQFELLREQLEHEFGLRSGPEQGPMGRRGDAILEDAEEVEELDAYDDVPVVVSIEDPIVRPERPIIDRDSGAEQAIRRRFLAAEARLTGRSKGDHARFDERIRVPPEEAPPQRAVLQPIPLRQAMMWREILGPPKSLE